MADDDFGELRAALLRGDKDAVGEVFRQYGQRLVALAHVHLGERLRQKVDADDVVQSVFRSFLVRCENGQFRLDDPDSLWALLMQITLRKCHRRVRYFLSKRRDVRKEAVQADGDAGVLDPNPTPDEGLLLADTVEEVMRRLSSDRKRQVFELSLQQMPVAEISERLGVYERGVLRARAEIKEILLSLLDDDGQLQP